MSDDIDDAPDDGADDDSLRDTLEAAFEDAETDVDSESTPEVSDGSAPQTPDSQSAGDEASTQAATEQSQPWTPVGMDNEAKAVWKDTPEPVRRAVEAREKEVNQVLQQTADERRYARQFAKTVAPFQSTLQGMGFNDPMAAVTDVLGSVQAMRSGSVEERAQACARIIQNMGIDISALDDALAGTIAPQQNVQPQIDQILQQRLAPMEQMLQQFQTQQAQHEQQVRHDAKIEVDQFSQGRPHLERVRNDMADLLDAAAARGINMSLEQAYDRACMLYPDIVEAREQQRRMAQQQAQTPQINARRTAGSSVTGTRAGVSGPAQPETLHDALSAAWDLHTGSV